MVPVLRPLAVLAALLVPAIVSTAPAVARNCGPGDPAGGGFQVALQSAANGQWVAVERDFPGTRSGLLRARSVANGLWERLYVECLGNQEIALRSVETGKWITTEIGGGYGGTPNEGALRARAELVQDWERFRYLPLEVPGGSFGDGPFALQSVANGRLVTVELGYSGGDFALLRAGATQVGPQQKFTAVLPSPVDDGPPPPDSEEEPIEPAPVPGGEVVLPTGCTPAGRGVLVKLKRKGGARSRVQMVTFYTRPRTRVTVDRKAPFRARVGKQLRPGRRARIYARVHYRVKGERGVRKHEISRRVKICRS